MNKFFHFCCFSLFLILFICLPLQSMNSGCQNCFECGTSTPTEYYCSTCTNEYNEYEHILPTLPTREQFEQAIKTRLNKNTTKEELVAPIDMGSGPRIKLSLLSQLAMRNHSDLITQLITHEPSINIDNPLLEEKYGPDATPLEFATKHKHLSTIKLLLSKGANPNIRGTFINTKIYGQHYGNPLHTLANATFNENNVMFLDDKTKKIINMLIVAGTSEEAFCHHGDALHGSFLRENNKLEEYSYDHYWNYNINDLPNFNIDDLQPIWEYNGRDSGYRSFSSLIQETAQQRNELFKAVENGEAISFNNTNKISRCHVRDTHGDNLLYHALQHGNHSVAKTLIVLWPHLITQPNFKGISAFETFPAHMIDVLNHSQP